MTAISDIFGIEIKNEVFFQTALTHTSYTKENELDYTHSYERFEFLGDAVLKLSISDILFKKYPDYPEGNMSKIRSIVVSDATLSEICKKIGLSELILIGKHEEKQGIRNLESVCACAFEAILGAYYLDGSYQKLLKFIERIFTPYIEEVDKDFAKFNAKELLQEYTQSLTKETPVYKLIGESGPAHNKVFNVTVSYRDEVLAQGFGKTKKEAEQQAAYNAYKSLAGVSKNG